MKWKHLTSRELDWRIERAWMMTALFCLIVVIVSRITHWSLW